MAFEFVHRVGAGPSGKKRSGRAVLDLAVVMAVAVTLFGCPGKKGPVTALEKTSVREGMEELVAVLDSPAYAKSMSWDEHVVLAYRVAQNREPTLLEFSVLRALNDHQGLRRSDVLALALRENAQRLTWPVCEQFLKGAAVSRFRADSQLKSVARELATASPEAIKEALSDLEYVPSSMPAPARAAAVKQAGVEYNTYYGFLHAHSHLSFDAEGDPLEAYTYARDEGELDFFALTDHAVFLAIWPWEGKWEQLVAAAESTYEPGSYVTLWGFEWSNPLLGHVNVINTPDFTDTLATFQLDGLYEWLAARPAGFGRFNHPGDYDYIGDEFHHLDARASVIPQMTGIETWNSGSSFDHFQYNGSWESDVSYLDAGNQKGWRLGALGAQDNHHGGWGTRNQFRTAVLAEELTREAIIDAYRNRRFYATEDKDLRLDFRCQGYPMGSRLLDEPRVFEVSATDGSGDTFIEARLYRNGSLIQSAEVEGSSMTVTFDDAGRQGDDYYYVIVTQADDNDGNGRNDEALSSSIWFGEVPVVPTGCAASAAPPRGGAWPGLTGDGLFMALVLAIGIGVFSLGRPRSI